MWAAGEGGKGIQASRRLHAGAEAWWRPVRSPGLATEYHRRPAEASTAIGDVLGGLGVDAVPGLIEYAGVRLLSAKALDRIGPAAKAAAAILDL